ncbi:ABC transporter permease [Sanyastnella coralliicola]|uniref:ABC transporter permease n=1 Tax=Sanyastnella coralliicola TaxID=3069118 RepID=UPI0027BAA6C0|nr:ABC transporter permease [Longitalea sp. SCSIO 12813]
MSKVGLIIKREYLSRVRKRSFIIMTILGPLLFAGLMAVAIFAVVADSVDHKVLVVDPEGLITRYEDGIGQYLPTCPDCFPERDDYIYRFTDKALADSTFMASDYTLMVSLLPDQYQHKKAELYYKKVPSSIATNVIEGDLEAALERAKVAESSLDYATYKALKVNIQLQKFSIDKGEEYDDSKAGIGMFFAVIIFFFIFLFGAYVMRGVIEEKTNRIVEVIVSSVKPFQLMMGKIIGVGFVAITQVVIWVAFSLIIFTIAGALFESGAFTDTDAMAQVMEQQGGAANMDFETYLSQTDGLSTIIDMNWGYLILMFIVFFVGGYVLYSSLFAAIGAVVDNETDTQQLMMPVMLPLFFAYFIAIMSVNNPEGVAAQVFSIIPFTSPTVMMVRVAVGNVPVWELLLSVVLLIATCFFMVWLAAKIYRTGILMYGKRPTYRELWKWLFYKT